MSANQRLEASRRAAPRALVAALLAASIAAAPEARADGTADIEALLEEPVVSTASRTAETQSAAPATSTILTAEDLRRFGIRSLDEAINYLSLGMLTQDPLHAVDIGARGVLFTGDFGNHVLLMVNGHVMNEPFGGTAYFEKGAGIPIELIDHIEVILGPGSVLYGSNSMLGVINIITKRAKDYAGTHLFLDLGLPTALRVGAGAGYGFKLFGAPAEVTAQAEYIAQNGPTYSFGPQDYGLDAVTGMPKSFSADGPPTGIWGGQAARSNWSQVPSAYVRMSVGNFELNARFALFRRATPYFNHTNTYALDFDEPNSYEADRFVSLDLRHHATRGFSSFTSRLYGDSYSYDEINITSAAEDCLDGQLHGCKRDAIAYSATLGAEEQVSLDWLRDGSLVTLLAVDGRGRHVGSGTDISDRLTGAHTAPQGTEERYEGALSISAQQTWRPLSWLGLNAGVRYDLDARFGSQFSPRAALSVSPWKGATAKLIYAQAFRSPTLFESAFADPRYIVPPTDLRPEHVHNIEGVVEQRFGTHRIMAGVFRSYFVDMIALEPLAPGELAQAIKDGKLLPGTVSALQYGNVNAIDSLGYNAAFEGAELEGRLRYGVNVTGAYTRKQSPDFAGTLPLTVTPAIFGNARVSYDLGGPLPTLALAAQLVGPRAADHAFDGAFTPTPYAPTQLLLRATISGAAPKLKGLSYRLSGSYAAADRNPYVVGPFQAATPTHPYAELVPVERFRATLGLAYDLPF